jgi:DNA-binding PadR family transcriptional regulator
MVAWVRRATDAGNARRVRTPVLPPDVAPAGERGTLSGPMTLADRIFEYLATRRIATPARLVSSLEVSEGELVPMLKEMEQRGWLSEGWARFIDSPDPEVQMFTLTRDGERQVALRGISDPGPMTVTREELVAELVRRGFGRSEDLEALPSLREDRFEFWPRGPAWGVPVDDDE